MEVRGRSSVDVRPLVLVYVYVCIRVCVYMRATT